MTIGRVDHVALTVADAVAAADFYVRVLDAQIVTDHVIDGRMVIRKVRMGQTVLNLHQQGNGVALVARRPTPGSADLCFEWLEPIENAVARLGRAGVAIVEGPSPRSTWDEWPGQSVYFQDLDGNLIELMARDPVTQADELDDIHVSP